MCRHFAMPSSVFFENGNGRKPKIRFVNVIEESTVVVGIKVRTRGLTTPTTWDLRLKMPDGREVAVPGVLWRIRGEELALRRRLGDPYRAYIKRTKRLVPGLY